MELSEHCDVSQEMYSHWSGINMHKCSTQAHTLYRHMDSLTHADHMQESLLLKENSDLSGT